MPFRLAVFLLLTTIAQAVQIPRPPAHGGCVAVSKGKLSTQWHLLSDSHRVRVEVENPVERGRGLGIASAAARDSGGRLALTTLDLPLAK